MSKEVYQEQFSTIFDRVAATKRINSIEEDRIPYIVVPLMSRRIGVFHMIPRNMDDDTHESFNGVAYEALREFGSSTDAYHAVGEMEANGSFDIQGAPALPSLRDIVCGRIALSAIRLEGTPDLLVGEQVHDLSPLTNPRRHASEATLIG